MNQYQVTIRERGVYSFTLNVEDADIWLALRNTQARFGYKDGDATFIVFPLQ